ncbi:MAG: hypothetical protein KA712_23755 [Myxococcales bacterium]|nr:hypothetical protein [Myxococcales bacterium]
MLRRWGACFVGSILWACAPPPEEASPPRPDPAAFASTVYPILLADCAFSGCHGNEQRFFRVHGPGRTRLDPATALFDPPTAEELALAYTRAASMLAGESGVRRGPLLRKPLAVEAGGAGHAGDDPWGQSIYLTKRDPRWEALFFWAVTAETLR